jgi:hypothetical protein
MGIQFIMEPVAGVEVGKFYGCFWGYVDFQRKNDTHIIRKEVRALGQMLRFKSEHEALSAAEKLKSEVVADLERDFIRNKKYFDKIAEKNS